MLALRTAFQIPDFGSAPDNRRAILLNLLIWLAILGIGLRTLIVALYPEESQFLLLNVRLVILTLLFGAWIVLRLGYPRPAIHLCEVAILSFAGISAIKVGNIAGDIHAMLLALIVAAGLAMGPIAVLRVGACSILLTMAATLSFEIGIVPGANFIIEPSIAAGISYSLILFAMTYLLYVGAGSFEQLLVKLLTVNDTLNLEIEKRTQTADALAQRQSELEMIFQSAPLGIVTFDLDGRILQTNRAFYEMIEDSEEALTAQRIHNLIEPTHLERFENQLMVLIQGEVTNEPIELEVQTTRSTILETYFRLGLVYAGDAQPHHIVATVADITERRRIERQMKVAQKNESVGLLAGGIAHDFNNLLGAVLAQNAVAQKSLQIGNPIEPHLQNVEKAAQKATLLTRQLLAYAGNGQIKIGHISLNRLLQENQELFALSLANNVQVITEFTPQLPLIKADLSQMQQVVMNLLINAGQAMPDKSGTIHIKTSLVELDDATLLGWSPGAEKLASGSYVLLEIRDDGQGMDKETLSQIFDPFFTTKEDGHGLGLAAVLGIVRSHGGGLRVDSQIGRGTSFQLIFPAAMPHSSPLDSAQLQGMLPQANGIEMSATAMHLKSRGSNIYRHNSQQSTHVLLIEDDEHVRLALTDILASLGYQVYTAATGQAGIEEFRQHNNAIDLVILDMVMPGLSSQETFIQIRSINANVPFIVSSGYSREQVNSTFLQHKRVEFLPKPFDADTLETLIDTMYSNG
ncbi:MAG: ATP-binding protein [Chloroflexota bacterium]